jgi:hypothetical protein
MDMTAVIKVVVPNINDCDVIKIPLYKVLDADEALANL